MGHSTAGRSAGGRRHGTATVAGLGAALLAVVAAGTATAGDAWQSQGGVRADVTWEGQRGAPVGLRMTIVRGAHRTTVAGALVRGWGLSPQGGTVVAVRNLDGDDEPEVVLNLRRPSARADQRSVIATWNATAGRYRVIAHSWGEGGYRWLDVNRDGRTEWLSTDSRLGGFGAPRAQRRAPVRIWELRRGAMVDVTRDFPAQVRADMRAHRAAATRAIARGQRPESALAAYLAGAELLPNADAPWAWARRVHTGAAARAYFTRLEGQLERLGYRR